MKKIYENTKNGIHRILYGFHINGNDPDPDTCITYLEDAVGMTPVMMNYKTGVFDYGSWANAFFLPRPCMLKFDGTVDYYLNPNDYSKKTDGTASDITSLTYGGNAMMEWGSGGKKIWYSIIPDPGDSSSATIYVSNEQIDPSFHAYPFINKNGKYVDHFYTPIYHGSLDSSNRLRSISGVVPMMNKTATEEITYATNNGSGWYIETYADVELINILLTLMGKSLDTQTVFGLGNCDGFNIFDSSVNYGMINSGTMNDKGLFWGNNVSNTTNRTGVKVFGMENWWGNQWRRFAGMINDHGDIKIKRCYGSEDGSDIMDYNTTGAGYLSSGVTPSGSRGGYLTTMDFSSGSMIPKVSQDTTSGHELQYYCDGLWYNNSQIGCAFHGGSCGASDLCGAFCVYLSTPASAAHWGVGVAPTFREA